MQILNLNTMPEAAPGTWILAGRMETDSNGIATLHVKGVKAAENIVGVTMIPVVNPGDPATTWVEISFASNKATLAFNLLDADTSTGISGITFSYTIIINLSAAATGAGINAGTIQLK